MDLAVPAHVNERIPVRDYAAVLGKALFTIDRKADLAGREIHPDESASPGNKGHASLNCQVVEGVILTDTAAGFDLTGKIEPDDPPRARHVIADIVLMKGNAVKHPV